MSSKNSRQKEVSVEAPPEELIDLVTSWNSHVGTIGSTNAEISVEEIEQQVAEEAAEETAAAIDEHDGSFARLGAQQHETAGLADMDTDGDDVESTYEQVFETLDVPEARAEVTRERVVSKDSYVEVSKDGVGSERISQRSAEEARFDRETDVAIDGSWGGSGDDSSVPEGKTLYTQERIAAREWELEHIRTERMDEPDQDAVDDVRMRNGRNALTYIATDKVKMWAVDEAAPQAEIGAMNPELLGELHQRAHALAERYHQPRHRISEDIAQAVLDQAGETAPTRADLQDAVFTVRDQLVSDTAVVRPIADITGYGVASVVGTITKLWEEPAGDKSYQAGQIEDDHGETAKFSVWKRSVPSVTLHEGDRVRFTKVSEGMYDGKPTLAVRSWSVVSILDPGCGPAPCDAARPPRKFKRGWLNTDEYEIENKDEAAADVVPEEQPGPEREKTNHKDYWTYDPWYDYASTYDDEYSSYVWTSPMAPVTTDGRKAFLRDKDSTSRRDMRLEYGVGKTADPIYLDLPLPGTSGRRFASPRALKAGFKLLFD
jgi:hypothetical protein